MIPQYVKDAFITLKNPLPEWATEDTLIKDVIQDSLEYFELMAELGLPDDSSEFKTIGDLYK